MGSTYAFGVQGSGGGGSGVTSITAGNAASVSGSVGAVIVGVTPNPQFNSEGIATPASGVVGELQGGVSGITNFVVRAVAGCSLLLQVGSTTFINMNGTSVSYNGIANFTAGIATNSHSTISSASVASGVAFTPSSIVNTAVNVNVNAVAAGTITITSGFSTGSENTILPTLSFTLGDGAVYPIPIVPAGMKVIVTLTGVGNTMTQTIITT